MLPTKRFTLQEFLNYHPYHHVNYCEIIIHPNGDISYCVPSHQERLIKECGIEREKLYDLIPIDCDVLDWLIDKTDCAAIWFEFGFLPNDYTEEQTDSLIQLKQHGCIAKDFRCMTVDRKEVYI